MRQPDTTQPAGTQRGNWIRLRTMIVLRWVAITGQILAITVATWVFGLQLPLGLCFLAIGLSAASNVVAMFVYPENKRLSETENLWTTYFDLLQLCFLLFLTGGLNNPFAMLVLGPVVLSSTVLSLGAALFVGATALALTTAMVFVHVPLVTAQGTILSMPDIFKFGHWTALVIAIVFVGVYSRRVTTEINSMSDALAATQMALAREQKLTDLGGVVAAAAHELGTPLATIKLTSAELMEELEGDQREDAALIREQADRCRDILRSMGRAGKDDSHLKQAPLSEIIREAAEPHQDRGKALSQSALSGDPGGSIQPVIVRQPEIIHGLRNLVQNAVDFADSAVWIETMWTNDTISIRIQDDGPGFPPHLIGRIGDPFMRRRRDGARGHQRPEYEGMGLGLFIAKTLLERTGAELTFANGAYNGTRGSGAIVEVLWRRAMIDVARSDTPSPALTPNQLILP
ncbi:sensor histidine kinase RegB [Pseudaestuariivita atlantica]|uniref:histidine kinase n=1 Tax=Pseudaestuariivita atlantica TaxID=1317121 RepID=A0A0L1JPJ6_9RHOB|nr:ActS/PrrB/RegB family redox-sensitive histidine kinase [Pseudaestuariivita atlantica]KNG93656.1 histidine kinase [Pseudaestuariivita atlantica]